MSGVCWLKPTSGVKEKKEDFPIMASWGSDHQSDLSLTVHCAQLGVKLFSDMSM